MIKRGLFATHSTAISTFTSTTHRFLGRNFGMSSQLHNIMVMQLQNRMLQNSAASFLRFSPSVSGEKIVNFTDNTFKRVKEACMLKAGSSLFFRPFSSHADVSRSTLRVRVPCASIGLNVLHDKPSGIFSTRYYSSDLIKNEKCFKGSHKFWKNGKQSNHKKNSESKSGSKDTSKTTKSDDSVQTVEKDTSFEPLSSQFSKNKKKAKMPANSKTREEKSSAEVQKQKKPTPKNKNLASSGSENTPKRNAASSVSAKKTNKKEITTKEVIQDTETKQVAAKVTKNGAIPKAPIPKNPAKKEAKPKEEGMKSTEGVVVKKTLNKDQKSMKPLCPPTSKPQVATKVTKNGAIPKAPMPKNPAKKEANPKEEGMKSAQGVIVKKTSNKDQKSMKPLHPPTCKPQVATKVTKNGEIPKAPIPKNPAKKEANPKEESMKSAEGVIVKKNLNKDQKSMKPLYPPTGKSVVIVESLTKAKVIQGYLGEMYEVLPSYGHIRNLAARSGSVRPNDDFSMVWEVPSAAWTHLKSIKVALAGTQNLILASDPDREGEAIAWHIIEMLRQQNALQDDVSIYRVGFNEITEPSIKSALQNPREIDSNMVHAYLARKALDYLIGFNMSPLLWKKLPGCQSAGRVQSAALALICDREMEIEEFKPQEYWSVEVEFNKNGQKLPISSRLTHLKSKKLTQFSITSDKEAEDIKSKIIASTFKVLDSKRSTTRQNPPSPYITSTLQQDAADKLQFSATYTMKLAQKLFEGVALPDGRVMGLITYTRTDGLHVSDQAANDIRAFVAERYSERFVSETPRKYFKKVKNVREAHGAIRPTDIRNVPENLAQILDEDSLKLYTLIWSRTVACQMEPSLTETLQIDIGDSENSIVLRSSCSKTTFLGFRAAYEDQVSKEQDSTICVFKVLDDLKKGDPLSMQKVEPKQNHTQPPLRYSEGSLVKKLEELGIGRPSTYASTIKVLQDRNYVAVKSRVLHPDFRGRMLSAFLSHHFTDVTDYSFTADLETELDNISAGSTAWKGLLRDYWTRFSNYCERASRVHNHQVEKMLEKHFEDFIYGSLPNDGNRDCPSCGEGTLTFKVSKSDGAVYFIGCNNHLHCKYVAKTIYGNDAEDEPVDYLSIHEPKVLGLHPGTQEKVLLKIGPYGAYVQLGEDRKGSLPKRASLFQDKNSGNTTLEDALELLRYPINLGNHPDDGRPVIIRLAKNNGFSIKHGPNFVSVPQNMKHGSITIEKAVELFKREKDVRIRGRRTPKPKRRRPKVTAEVEEEDFF